MTCASAGHAVPSKLLSHRGVRLLGMTSAWQPTPNGKFGVVRPCYSASCCPLLWLCFDRCIQGWCRRNCQLSPGLGEEAVGRARGLPSEVLAYGRDGEVAGEK
jgi:hypothetical protein